LLRFEHSWRFDSPGSLPPEAVSACLELIQKIAPRGSRKIVLEHFKSYFANAAGIACSSSSSERWAETDLEDHMDRAAANAPLFIEAMYDACNGLNVYRDFAIPGVERINRILSEHRTGFQIEPPDLKFYGPYSAVAVPVSNRNLSLDEQAVELVQKSLKDSEQLLAEGRHRQAVQEILWLLETVSTVFQGIDTDAGTIEGKYFNKIAGDLRRLHRGQTLDQVLSWTTNLHGYLSSPTGGGVRHGTVLKAAIKIHPSEARLFCNLIRSYITYLLSEHERLGKT
jgi:hypothetical protein